MVANPHGGLSRSGRHEPLDVVNYIAEKSLFLTCSSKDAIFSTLGFLINFKFSVSTFEDYTNTLG